MNRTKKLGSALLVIGWLASVCGCGGGDDSGGTSSGASSGATSSSGGTSGGTTADSGAGSSSGATTKGMTLTADVAVPADFAGQPAKIVFGYGKKQIVDANGKFMNIPEKFLPGVAGIPDPKITPGQAYRFELKDAEIPAGEYYVLVALYVKGTAGTIPEKDKDYVAGSQTAVSFNGSTVAMPQLSFIKSAGM
jgi:hypothetical protein